LEVYEVCLRRYDPSKVGGSRVRIEDLADRAISEVYCHCIQFWLEDFEEISSSDFNSHCCISDGTTVSYSSTIREHDDFLTVIHFRNREISRKLGKRSGRNKHSYHLSRGIELNLSSVAEISDEAILANFILEWCSCIFIGSISDCQRWEEHLQGTVNGKAIHHASAIVVNTRTASSNEPLGSNLVIHKSVEDVENGYGSIYEEGSLGSVLEHIFIQHGHFSHLW